MSTSDVQVTAAVFWQVTPFVVLVDALLVLGIGRLLPPDLFRRLPRWVTLCSFLVFSAIWSNVLIWGWDWFYSYVFPPWMHYAGLAWGAAYGAVGLGMWWLSQRLPGRPSVNFCLLGGLEGLLTHLWAIYGAGVLTRPPMFRGVGALPVLTFAVFEKAFYWIIILLLAVGLAHLAKRIRGTQ